VVDDEWFYKAAPPMLLLKKEPTYNHSRINSSFGSVQPATAFLIGCIRSQLIWLE